MFFLVLLCGPTFGRDFQTYTHSTDTLESRIKVDDSLHSPFFTTSETSYPWHIIRHDDGSFEDTLDGTVSRRDMIPLEHTAQCISTHQGNHQMDFCHARLSGNTLKLEIYGGLPAFASSLMIEINGSQFKCFFRAAYPVQTPGLRWNILSKELVVKTLDFKKGSRMPAKINVTFEEITPRNGKELKEQYEIVGYIKPVIQ